MHSRWSSTSPHLFKTSCGFNQVLHLILHNEQPAWPGYQNDESAWRDQVIKMMNLRDVTRLSKWWKYVKMMNLHGASTWGYHNQLQTWRRVEISYPVTCMVTTTGQGYESYRCHLELQADYGRSKARRCEVCSKGGQHSVAICTATQDTNHNSSSLISLWFLWT